ncbi:hypothetical protein GCM10011344_18230 [Dokdonia pacifica]|uniref:Erythromycin esterase n=1 Tax=Dokdonia pacifica TaxID=1627892 RepID=A0A238VT93_9FLAO|nr:hypothetical protein GCM10011344_18230 [Dokdonia pacifica]SNR37374.1 hypothetical protein SAMN06265376_101314 [Dokdonia pacifica]
MSKTIIIYVVALCSFSTVQAQDSLLIKQLTQHVETFSIQDSIFQGKGWTTLLKEIEKSGNVLIGESHFTKEIPYFTSQIATHHFFDNFIFEIDPFSAAILEDKIKNLNASGLEAYYKTYGENFSFYASKPEYELLKQLAKAGTSFIGTDQIIKIGDRLIFSELASETKNETAKVIFNRIVTKSAKYYDAFLEDTSKDFYIETKEFLNDLEALSSLDLSEKEKKCIAAFYTTVKIFNTDDHSFRIDVMKHQLMNRYDDWGVRGKKNLFKYGAVHAPKGESLLRIYDIGNLVNNISDSHFDTSLHIMIVGMTGTSGAPFKGFPPQNVSYEKGMLQPISLFFNAVKGDQWHCFDTRPIWKAYLRGELTIKSTMIKRILKGYDYVIIIPEVTAAVVEKK